MLQTKQCYNPAQKFKKPASPKLTIVPVSTEEPMGKLKRVKRLAKKSTKAPARGVVIRETLEMPLSKKKENVDSMRDFHKTHPSGSGAVKIIPLVTSEGTGVKPGVPNVTEEESFESEAKSWGNDEDDSNNEQDSSGEDSDQKNDSDDDKTQSDNENESDSEHETDENESGSESDQEEDEDDEEEVKDELVKTPSNDSDDEDETKITDKAEGDEDEEMDYTTSQLYDDVDIRLNEPVDTDKGFVQEEGTDAAMTNVQQGNENPKIIQVIEDAHVTLSTVPQKTEVPVTSSSHSSDLAAKFLNFSDIPHTDAEIVSPMDVHVHHEVPSQQTPTLLTVPVSVISDSSPVFSTVIPQSLPSFTPPPQQSTSTPPPTTEATNPLSTLPDFASVFQFNNRVTTLEKEVVELKKDLCTLNVFLKRKPKRFGGDTDEDRFAGSEQGLKKRKTSKDAEPTKGPKAKESQSGSSKGTKSQLKSFGKSVQSEELEFVEPTDPDWNADKTSQLGQNQSWLMTLASSADKPLLKGTRSNYAELEYDFEECYKALLEKLDWENPEGGDYPFDLTKPLPLDMSRNRQKVPVDYFFNNDLKYLQGGILTMTYTTSLKMTKAAQYDLQGIEDMREQRKSFYGYARGLQSRHDVYSTKRIMAVTRVEVMRKHRYGYLKEIVVRRADNDLYRFKEGDFPRLRINDIEDMLLLVVQNRLTNLSGDDVSDFAIALRMFTKSLVIQKRVKDLQLGVESFQKKINITRPETTKYSIRKRDPYTPYQDPQGFIYVNNNGRNRMMRSDKLYKFSDRTLTGLRTSLDDITKNI
ncbi:hypothetical protein Tco_1457215 [Tanacetum coccineum]